jgi:adenylate kinase
MRPQLILLGAPGSGKGTQAAALVKHFGYNHVSTGDLLRKEIAEGSDLGLRVQSIMDAGNLVDDSTVLELLSKNCDVLTRSYIFDGFPRNIEQARLLDQVVLKDTPVLAVLFDLDLEVIVERIVNRRMAPKSGEIYNLISRPPKQEGLCDVSGEPLIQRKDDNEETVRNRLKVYEDAINPVLEYYREKGVLRSIDASQSSEKVLEELRTILG